MGRLGDYPSLPIGGSNPCRRLLNDCRVSSSRDGKLPRLRAALGAFVEDCSDKIEAKACGKQRSDARRIVRWRDLDEVNAHDLESRRHFLQDVAAFVVGEAAMADRRRAGGDRGIEAVDVD